MSFAPDPPPMLLEVLKDGETLLVWSACRQQGDRGIFALTSDRVLFVNDLPLGISVAQRIAQGRTMRLRDEVLEMGTPDRDLVFSELPREVIEEVVGTLGKKVKVTDAELARRVKSHRALVRKRVRHSMTKVPKNLVARDLTDPPPG